MIMLAATSKRSTPSWAHCPRKQLDSAAAKQRHLLQLVLDGGGSQQGQPRLEGLSHGIHAGCAILHGCLGTLPGPCKGSVLLLWHQPAQPHLPGGCERSSMDGKAAALT